jgi:D-alanyl-D-alanine dipeptidase
MIVGGGNARHLHKVALAEFVYRTAFRDLKTIVPQVFSQMRKVVSIMNFANNTRYPREPACIVTQQKTLVSFDVDPKQIDVVPVQ